MSPRDSMDHQSAHSSAITMPRIRNAIPPPLPPPQHLPDLLSGSDPGWQWANDPSSADYGRPATVKSGSSLLGSSARHRRNESGSDEGAFDLKLHSERRLEHTTFQGSSQAYDKQLLSRIGGPSTPRRQSLTGSPALDPSHPQLDTDRRRPSQLHELERRGSDLHELERRGSHLHELERRGSQLHEVDRRASQPHKLERFGSQLQDTERYGSQLHDPERRGCPLRMLPIVEQEHGRDRRLPSVSSTTSVHKKSDAHEQGVFTQDDVPMDGVSTYERSPSNSEDLLGSRPGAKRRASSPPHDDYRDEDHLSPRRQPLIHDFRSHASLSSASSISGRGSLVSSLGMASTTSSATSYASGMISSPTATSNDDPKPVSYPVRSLPRNDEHDAEKGSTGVFICDCCPKKPKRFETAADLTVHQSEKQYSCLYCSNRFKNKNEAERHQNSLHLRRHSWSCAALTKPQSAFHASISSKSCDVCGFCGQEYPNPADWVERTAHLEQAHKFGQCNLAKKFFRADHFRQHLKHSHDGTSGKWTNMLESACMKDEPAPPQIGSAKGVLSEVQSTAQHAMSSGDNLRQ